MLLLFKNDLFASISNKENKAKKVYLISVFKLKSYILIKSNHSKSCSFHVSAKSLLLT